MEAAMHYVRRGHYAMSEAALTAAGHERWLTVRKHSVTLVVLQTKGAEHKWHCSVAVLSPVLYASERDYHG